MNSAEANRNPLLTTIEAYHGIVQKDIDNLSERLKIFLLEACTRFNSLELIDYEGKLKKIGVLYARVNISYGKYEDVVLAKVSKDSDARSVVYVPADYLHFMNETDEKYFRELITRRREATSVEVVTYGSKVLQGLRQQLSPKVLE